MGNNYITTVVVKAKGVLKTIRQAGKEIPVISFLCYHYSTKKNAESYVSVFGSNYFLYVNFYNRLAGWSEKMIKPGDLMTVYGTADIKRGASERDYTLVVHATKVAYPFLAGIAPIEQAQQDSLLKRYMRSYDKLNEGNGDKAKNGNSRVKTRYKSKGYDDIAMLVSTKKKYVKKKAKEKTKDDMDLEAFFADVYDRFNAGEVAEIIEEDEETDDS